MERKWKYVYISVSNPKKIITLHNGNPNWAVDKELEDQLYNWMPLIDL